MNPSNPFSPDPLGEFEPKKPDFEPEIDPDYEFNLEEDCLSCGKQLGCHSSKDIVQCAGSFLSSNLVDLPTSRLSYRMT